MTLDHLTDRPQFVRLMGKKKMNETKTFLYPLDFPHTPEWLWIIGEPQTILREDVKVLEKFK